MHHSLIDDCPVCRGLHEYQGILQAYIKDRRARIFSPQIGAMLFQIQSALKGCTGYCGWTLAALDWHAEIAALLSEIWEHLNDHRFYLEYIMRPTAQLKESGIDLQAMRDYLDAHGLMPLRDSRATDAEFVAAADRYLSLCEREGLHHIVEMWVTILSPELVIEPPF